MFQNRTPSTLWPATGSSMSVRTSESGWWVWAKTSLSVWLSQAEVRRHLRVGAPRRARPARPGRGRGRGWRSPRPRSRPARSSRPPGHRRRGVPASGRGRPRRARAARPRGPGSPPRGRCARRARPPRAGSLGLGAARQLGDGVQQLGQRARSSPRSRRSWAAVSSRRRSPTCPVQQPVGQRARHVRVEVVAVEAERVAEAVGRVHDLGLDVWQPAVEVALEEAAMAFGASSSAFGLVRSRDLVLHDLVRSWRTMMWWSWLPAEKTSRLPAIFRSTRGGRTPRPSRRRSRRSERKS